MTSISPFIVHFVWANEVSWENGVLQDDNTLETIFFYSETVEGYQAQFEIQIEPMVPISQQSFTNQLLNITENNQTSFSHGFVDTDNYYQSTSQQPSNSSDSDSQGGEDTEEYSDSSDGTMSVYSIEQEMSEDDEQEEPVTHDQGNLQTLHELNIRSPFDDEEKDWNFWSKDNTEIKVGVVFQSKSQLVLAVKLWHIKENRELIVQDTRPEYWKAMCITRGKHFQGAQDPSPCRWTVTGSCRNKHKIWKIVKWVDHHNCYSHVVNNNNRCVTSSIVATEIAHLIKEKIDLKVSVIQTHIKQCLNVDIGYGKAWNGRRIAIERLYGTWESNFYSLPTYIDELKRSNPETIVEWLHDPNSSNNIFTFKYVFWAFEAAIHAFLKCIPVIFVDGTHLKGNYKGKLLTAVTKNANSQILPIAYALVDEETNDSWSWFLENFNTHIGSRRTTALCVISDRHQGIINAMENIDGWHHRYCLRHVCSNVNTRFKNSKLKGFCWTLGATGNADRYKWAIRKIRGTDEAAWDYLKDIGLGKLTLLKDSKHRRWGNTTTNIAESLNNVFGMARMLPIRSLIDHTFQYTRAHIVNHYTQARDCDKPLAPNLWAAYEIRVKLSTTYHVAVYDEHQGLYTVTTNNQDGKSDNMYTVTFGLRKCSCGRWQNQRLPCSHALAVAGKRKVEGVTLPSKRYTTNTWRSQYSVSLNPIRDVQNWRQSNWVIQGDPSRLITRRGRRRTTRYKNEMDEHASSSSKQPRESTRCGRCNELGHNRKTCTHP